MRVRRIQYKLNLCGLLLWAGLGMLRVGYGQTQELAILSFDDCVQELIQQNPDLQAAQEAVAKTRNDLVIRFSPFLPQVSADGNASRNGGDTSSGYSVGDSLSIGLSARQNLFSGFKDQARLEQGRALLSAEAMRLRRVKSELSLTLKTAFYRLVYADDFLRLAQTIATRRKDNVQLVELRFEAGREHKGSYLRNLAFFHQAQSDVTQAKRAVQTAQQQLASLLGRREDSGLTVNGRLIQIKAPEFDPEYKRLLGQTPDHLEALSQWRAARDAVRIAQADFYPELNASASAGRQNDDFPINQEQWSVGLSLSLPLFTGGRTLFTTRNARLDQSISRAKLESVDDLLAATLRERFTDWQDAVERAGIQAEFLTAAQLRAEIARGQYSNGLITYDDWDLIENDLIEKEKALLAVRRDAILAHARWERIIGEGAIP